MKIVLLGPPGAGKGTQAVWLSEKFSIPAISTGQIIRNAIKEKTPMGVIAEGYIAKGELLPDDAAVEIVKERLKADDCKNGYLLDGFPRTLAQAEVMDEAGIDVDFALEISVSDDEIVNRLSGRRVCEKCGRSYHTEYLKPKTDGTCDDCGSNLIIRKDDEPDVILNRLHVYHELTEPLKKFYEDQGKLRSVIGQEKVEDTTRLVLEAVSK